MMPVYSLVLSASLLLGAPFWLFQMLRKRRYRQGLAGRLGRVPAPLLSLSASSKTLWIHAVSVGEVLAVGELIRELQAALPGWALVLSSTTAAGHALAQERFPELLPFFFPLDLRFSVRRYLAAIRPRMVVLVESEIWPRLLKECGARGTPVVVVNARMSDRSFRRAWPLRRVWAPVLRQVSTFLTQGSETADRLQRLGVAPERIRNTGNLKFDLRAPGHSSMLDRICESLPVGSPVLICGSTLEGEEAMLLAAWPEVLRKVAGAVMILAPRHPDRFDAVGRLLAARGCVATRATQLRVTGELPAGGVLLLDTIGDLAAVYSLASVAFVGGSLVPAGGHNPLEPARFAVPVLVGPSMENFREMMGAMLEANGICTVTPDDLVGTVVRLLRDPAEAQALGRRAHSIFATYSGATRRTADAVLELLEQSGRGPSA